MFWTTLRQCNSNTLSTCEVDVFLVITQFISFCNKQHKYSTISNIHRDMQVHWVHHTLKTAKESKSRPARPTFKKKPKS